MLGCIFCKIAAGERPATIYYRDDRCIAFQDNRAQAPVHALVIPRKHISSLNEAGPEDAELLGHLLSVAARTAQERGVHRSGFRVVINTNPEAGQTVYHLHLHVLGGRTMDWPPG